MPLSGGQQHRWHHDQLAAQRGGQFLIRNGGIPADVDTVPLQVRLLNCGAQPSVGNATFGQRSASVRIRVLRYNAGNA
jgi:hypothetical protein